MGNSSGFNLKNFYTILSQQKNLLFQYQFKVHFRGLEGRVGGGDVSDISYYIQSGSIPEMQLTNAKAHFLGTEFRVPGVRTYTHNWNANVIITNDLRAYDIFRSWQATISDLSIDGGGNKTIGDVNMVVSILNPDNTTVAKDFTLYGVWVKSVGEMSMKYAQGGGDPLTSFPVEFRYQYAAQGADPLS